MRIAQITDLHLRHHQAGTSWLSTRQSRRVPELLVLALREVRRQDIDLLAVTGDLLDMPSEDAAGTAAEADYRLVKQLLDDSGVRYMVVPGNHDSLEVMRRVFDPAENVVDIAGHRVVRFCDEEHEGHVPRRYLLERQRFDSVLGDRSSPPQVHLQHYVLTPRLDEGYPHTYDEGEELTRRVVAAKVRLCLSGHYHEGTELSRQDQTWFAAGPAFCQSPFPWRTYEIDTSGGVTMQRHVME